MYVCRRLLMLWLSLGLVAFGTAPFKRGERKGASLGFACLVTWEVNRRDGHPEFSYSKQPFTMLCLSNLTQLLIQ